MNVDDVKMCKNKCQILQILCKIEFYRSSREGFHPYNFPLGTPLTIGLCLFSRILRSGKWQVDVVNQTSFLELERLLAVQLKAQTKIENIEVLNLRRT